EYVATLSGLSSGIYTYTWHARDSAGNEQTSPPYQFEVLEYSDFTIHVSDLLVQPGEQITLTGHIQRSDGFYPALVDIYDGQSFVTTSSVSQIDGSFSALLTLDLGTHSIKATVSDVNGITGESNVIDAITVKGLSINITITDDVVMPIEPFTITGVVRYSDNTYPPQVDLYVDNQFVRKINVSAPGGISEAHMISTVGMHSVKVELTDADGIRGSDSAMVNVKSLSIDAELSTASILHFESSQLSGYAYYSDGSHPSTVDIHINDELHAAVNVYEFGFYSYTISGLGVGDYTVVVKHRDADGISGASSPLTLSVGDNPPTQNTQIVIENTATSVNGTLIVHSDQPTLTWTGGTDPDGDVVYTHITVSAVGPGGAEILNVSTAENNYTLPKLDFQKMYYVRMQTYSGTGVVSEPYDFVIETANNPPGEPGPFAPAQTRNPSPVIAWIQGVDPDGDAVNTLITVQGMQTVEVSGNSYQLPELQLGTYTITTQSEDPFGAVSATVQGTLEILPTNISLIQPIGGEQLSSTTVLKTDVSGDVDRVIYYYSQDNGVTWVQVGQSLSQISPYTILWDTTKAANGPAVVKVTMIDLYKRTYEDFSEEVYIQNKAPSGAKYERVFGGDGTVPSYGAGEAGASPVVAVLFFVVIIGAIFSAMSAIIEYVKLPGHLSIGDKMARMSKENIYILAFLGIIAVILDIGYGVFNVGILVMMFQDIVLLTVVGILVGGLWYFRGKKPPIPTMHHRPEFMRG
ncbi:hypothetical protein KKA03_07155, partial [archaeon]|nr:hypothetical protein [archaeon]